MPQRPSAGPGPDSRRLLDNILLTSVPNLRMWHNPAAIRAKEPIQARDTRVVEQVNPQSEFESRKVLEMGQLLEGSKSFFNFFVVQDSQTVKAKGFYGK